MKYCLDCGAKKSDSGEYCKSCGYKHRIRPKGLRYKIVVKNKSWFKKGHSAWHKNTHGLLIAWNKGLKGTHFSPKTEFKKGEMSGEKNPNWKGDDVGYSGLHAWVHRNLGKAKICSKCGITKGIQWANKSHDYKRKKNDWISLCQVCHHRYDGITKLSKKQVKEIKNKLKEGVKQNLLSIKFGVDQSTISNINRNKIYYYV